MERVSPPSPRNGALGLVDEIIGPGATGLEIAIQLVPLPLGAALGWIHARASGLDVMHGVVAAVLAIDVLGGVISNSTSAAKRWYHREGQGFAQHMSFVSIHVLHIIVVAWLFRDANIGYALLLVALLLGAATIILIIPHYIQRAVALGLYGSIASIHAMGMLGSTPGLEWFVPLFFLKLLISHILDEIPFPAATRSPSSPSYDTVDW